MAHAWKLPSKTAPTRPNARKKVRGKKKKHPVVDHQLGIFFFSFAPFWPHEGPLVQSCFTGQLPGTDFFYTGLSPDVLEVGKV